MSGTVVDYRTVFETDILNWSSWDNDKIVSALTHACLQDWSKTRNIEVNWTEMDLKADRLRPLSLIVWVSSSVSEADFICTQVERFRRQYPQTIQLAYLSNVSLHRASAMIQNGMHVVVHPLERLPRTLHSLLPNLKLIPQAPSVLLEGMVSHLPWNQRETG